MGRVVRMLRKESGVNLAPLCFFFFSLFLYGILEFWFLTEGNPRGRHHFSSLVQFSSPRVCPPFLFP